MTRSDRLTEVIKRYSPRLKARLEAGEPWGEDGAPYRIEEWRGQQRIVVTDPETGDSIGGVGATVEEALAQLEGRLR